jgi:hypothetical protein
MGDGFAGFPEGVLGNDIELRADFLNLFLRNNPGVE